MLHEIKAPTILWSLFWLTPFFLVQNKYLDIHSLFLLVTQVLLYFCDKRENCRTMTGTRQSQTETAAKRPLCHQMTLLFAEVSSCRHFQQLKFNYHLPTSVRKRRKYRFPLKDTQKVSFFRPVRGEVRNLSPDTSEQLREFTRSQLTRCYSNRGLGPPLNTQK